MKLKHEAIERLLTLAERDLRDLRNNLAMAESRGDSIDGCETYIVSISEMFGMMLREACFAVKRDSNKTANDNGRKE